MKKIKWCLKQLFPLTYQSKFRSGNIKYFVVFKMWLGRAYKVNCNEVQ